MPNCQKCQAYYSCGCKLVKGICYKCLKEEQQNAINNNTISTTSESKHIEGDRSVPSETGKSSSE